MDFIYSSSAFFFQEIFRVFREWEMFCIEALPIWLQRYCQITLPWIEMQIQKRREKGNLRRNTWAQHRVLSYVWGEIHGHSIMCYRMSSLALKNVKQTKDGQRKNTRHRRGRKQGRCQYCLSIWRSGLRGNWEKFRPMKAKTTSPNTGSHPDNLSSTLLQGYSRGRACISVFGKMTLGIRRPELKGRNSPLVTTHPMLSTRWWEVGFSGNWHLRTVKNCAPITKEDSMRVRTWLSTLWGCRLGWVACSLMLVCFPKLFFLR